MKNMISLKHTWHYVYNQVKSINDSKLFAGLIVIILNVSSKFTTVPISKTMESYLKNSFSKHILVFAICWMGTRDIITATIVFLVFTILMQVFLNEQSTFCCLTEEFTDYHLSLGDDTNDETITKDEFETCSKILEKAKNILNKTNEDIHTKSATTKHSFLNQTMISS